MPWQNSSGPQSAAPAPDAAPDPPAGASEDGAEPLDDVGVLEAGVPDVPDGACVPDVGAAGVLEGSVLPSELAPDED